MAVYIRMRVTEGVALFSFLAGMQVKVVLRADVSTATYDKVAVISGV